MANEYSASIYIQPSFQNYSNNSKPIKTHYAGLMSVQHKKIPTFGKKPRLGELGSSPGAPPGTNGFPFENVIFDFLRSKPNKPFPLLAFFGEPC